MPAASRLSRAACPWICAAGLITSLGAGAPVAVHPGDTITDRQLFAYLAFPSSNGWVRYRVRFADKSTVEKTVGFGSETLAGKTTAFIETHVSAQGVTGLVGPSPIPIGTDAVLKTYVDAVSVGDISQTYRVISSALKVGGFEYEVTPGQGQTFSILTGAQQDAPRQGKVRSVDAVDLRVAGRVVHCTHIVAAFRAAPLPLGGTQAPYTLELWQSPDVPLGTVAIVSDGGRSIDWRLVAFGRSGYKSLFVKTLDQIRRASQPGM